MPVVWLITAVFATTCFTTLAYSCEGSGCCDYVCKGGSCSRSVAGVAYPTWWEQVGWTSCKEKLTAHYNATIKCSEALAPYATCGLTESYACGYGLACVAQSINHAQCLPLCGSSYPKSLADAALVRFDLSEVASGCTLDGQSGATNSAAGYSVSVGNVELVGSTAVPKCIRTQNTIIDPTLPGTLIGLPPPATNGPPTSDINCTHVCAGSHCASTRDGRSIPGWWIFEGYENCAQKVSRFYNASIPCSKGIPAWQPCGLKETPHACAYGLACLAQSITYAQCVPICGSHFPGGLRDPQFAGWQTSVVAAGCSLDGQLGHYNTDSGYVINTGAMSLHGTKASPSCIEAQNLIQFVEPAVSIPNTALPQAVPSTEGPPASAGPPERDETRIKFAASVVGLGMAYFEGQRAGLKPVDGDTAVPQVWASWKQEAFVTPCRTFLEQNLTAEERAGINLAMHPGYFEAGSAHSPIPRSQTHLDGSYLELHKTVVASVPEMA
jgi:hypothetical protein